MPDSLHGGASDDRADPLHPRHDPGHPNRVHTETIAQWPAGTFLENLAPDLDGKSWLVTSPSDHAVYRVGPDSQTSVAARYDGIPTGIVSHPILGIIVAVGTQGQPNWRLHRITTKGSQDLWPLSNVLSANGMTWAGDRLLVVDSGASTVVAVDPTTGATEPWLEHPLLTPVSAQSPLPGVNGIDYYNGTVILSSSDRGLILAVSATSPRPDEDLQVLAERLVSDDLAIAPDGRIFIATHTYHTVLCLHPNGWREDIATHADGVAGPTAVSIGTGPQPELCVCTSGGLLSPPAGQVEPARLMRVDGLRH